jgi:hypothetical protein
MSIDLRVELLGLVRWLDGISTRVEEPFVAVHAERTITSGFGFKLLTERREKNHCED